MKLTNNLYYYPEKGGFDCNAYVIKGNPGIIIDPGNAHFLPSLAGSLRHDGIDPKSIGIIVNTHLHPDHCSANEAFKQLSGARIGLHPLQQNFYNMFVIDAARELGLPLAEFKADFYPENEKLNVGGVELELIPSPGHSPESVCFYCRQGRFLICGDVLFNGNTGRVDLPGGSADELRESIERLSKLDIDYLLPGHMDIVSGAGEVKRNFDFIRENILRWL